MYFSAVIYLKPNVFGLCLNCSYNQWQNANWLEVFCVVAAGGFLSPPVNTLFDLSILLLCLGVCIYFYTDLVLYKKGLFSFLLKSSSGLMFTWSWRLWLCSCSHINKWWNKTARTATLLLHLAPFIFVLDICMS